MAKAPDCSELARIFDDMVRIISQEPGVNTLAAVMPRINDLVPGTTIEEVIGHLEEVRLFDADQRQKKGKSQYAQVRDEAREAAAAAEKAASSESDAIKREADAEAKYIARLERQIAQLEEDIAKGDFEPRSPEARKARSAKVEQLRALRADLAKRKSELHRLEQIQEKLDADDLSVEPRRPRKKYSPETEAVISQREAAGKELSKRRSDARRKGRELEAGKKRVASIQERIVNLLTRIETGDLSESPKRPPKVIDDKILAELVALEKALKKELQTLKSEKAQFLAVEKQINDAIERIRTGQKRPTAPRPDIHPSLKELRSIASDLRVREDAIQREIEEQKKIERGELEDAPTAKREFSAETKASLDRASAKRVERLTRRDIQQLEKALESGSFRIPKLSPDPIVRSEVQQWLDARKARLRREISLTQRLEALQKKEEELEKLKPGQLPDPPPRPSPFTGDKGLDDIEIQISLAKKRIRQKEQELQPRGLFYPIRRLSREAQTLLTFGEFSAALNQGGNFAKRHPVQWAKAYVAGGIKSVKSEEDAQRVIRAIMESPNYDLYVRGGMHITDPQGEVSGREEGLMGASVQNIPGLKGVARFHSGILNVIRKMEFDMMVEALGGREAMTDKILKDIGNWTNLVTGRGSLGRFEQSGVAMADYLFAPRWYSSRIQMMLGVPIWKANSKEVRRYIAKQYARWMIGHAAMHVGTALVIASLGDDEGENDKVSIEWNPTSTDFGKIKIGDSRIDVMEGYQTWIRFLARAVTGTRKTGSGEIVPIRGEDKAFGQGVGIEAFRLARGKASVLVGTALDIAEGEDFKGEPVTLKSLYLNRIGSLGGIPAPITFGDIYDVLKQDIGVPEKLALSLLAFNGAFVSTYSDKDKAAAKTSGPKMPKAPSVPTPPSR